MTREQVIEIQKRFAEAQKAGQIKLTNGGFNWTTTGGKESEALDSYTKQALAERKPFYPEAR